MQYAGEGEGRLDLPVTVGLHCQLKQGALALGRHGNDVAMTMAGAGAAAGLRCHAPHASRASAPPVVCRQQCNYARSQQRILNQEECAKLPILSSQTTQLLDFRLHRSARSCSTHPELPRPPLTVAR